MNARSYSSAASSSIVDGEVVAQVREQLGAGLDEVEVLAVALLGLVAVGCVVGALGLLAVGDQRGLLVLEQLELALNQVREARAAHRSSR